MEVNKKQTLAPTGKIHAIHWLIIFLSVLLTFSAWYYSQYQVKQKLEIKFEREAEQVVSLVKERMALYENALKSGVAYMDALDTDVNLKQWKAYANSLQIEVNYPGINGLGVIYNIQPEQLATYLKQQRILRPNYNIHPYHTRIEYWPITYVEPVALNEQAIGLDVAFEQKRYASITEARDTGESRLTAPITLVQDQKKTAGFLLYTPFYKNGMKPNNAEERRENIIGVIYAPFIMKNLMEGTLAEKNRHVSLKISDKENLLFDDAADNNSIEIDKTPLFSKDINMVSYGRIWTFSIQSNISFEKDTTLDQSSIILIGGLIIDALLLLLFLFLSKANRQALTYANQVTLALESKAEHLEKSNKDLEQFSYVASHDLKSPLNAINQLVSWIEEDCEELLPIASKKHLALLRQRSRRMMRLLDDLLDYSRLNLKPVANDIVNLHHTTQDIMLLLEKSNNFRCIAPLIEISIPLAPFEIVLRNLISNSIKHHDRESGYITITYQDNDEFHVIAVEDDGPGIPEALHEKAMEMFQTLKPRDQVEGSGMGLAMIKRIVENYEGNVKITSDGQRGTKITVQWPKEIKIIID
ncbi:CHASE domain-containing protein [Psychromonas algicola]|uniref:CHASE domain-containing protein n=1 Tax=Psychromonas algicola TaxID=2555642 RepID=UPI0010680287|nr:CHASE domain-containing protein [Psychromonas sp. RZ5]TEW47272.1 GHKL domain-containing protein [Psychromonas sp. RZ5]